MVDIGRMGKVGKAPGPTGERTHRDEAGPGNGPKDLRGTSATGGSLILLGEEPYGARTTVPLHQVLGLAAVPERNGGLCPARLRECDEPCKGLGLDPGHVSGNEEDGSPTPVPESGED